MSHNIVYVYETNGGTLHMTVHTPHETRWHHHLPPDGNGLDQIIAAMHGEDEDWTTRGEPDEVMATHPETQVIAEGGYTSKLHIHTDRLHNAARDFFNLESDA